MREMSGQPMRAAGTAIRCGAALAIVTLLAVIGTSANDAPAPVASSTGRANEAPVTGGAAAVHRRHVFEERRAHRDHARLPRLSTGEPSEIAAAPVLP